MFARFDATFLQHYYFQRVGVLLFLLVFPSQFVPSITSTTT